MTQKMQEGARQQAQHTLMVLQHQIAEGNLTAETFDSLTGLMRKLLFSAAQYTSPKRGCKRHENAFCEI